MQQVFQIQLGDLHVSCFWLAGHFCVQPQQQLGKIKRPIKKLCLSQGTCTLWDDGPRPKHQVFGLFSSPELVDGTSVSFTRGLFKWHISLQKCQKIHPLFFFFFSLLILTELKTLYELSMHFFSCFPSSLHFTLLGPLSAVLQQPGRGRLPHCDAQHCPELGSDREENWEKNDVKSWWLRMDSGMRIAGRERLLLKQQVWKNANYRSHSKKHQV